MLRVVFMGSPDFAVPSLRSLHGSEHEVVAVVTNPDRPAGRGRKFRPTAVKEFAGRNGLQPVLQPDDLRDPKFLNDLKNLEADLFVVVAFRMLPEAVLDIPRLCCVNLHASCLPDYRGAAPINWVLINGESRTGVTTFILDRNMDTGKIIHQKQVKINKNETFGTLHDKMMVRGARLLLKTVGRIDKGGLRTRHQANLITPAKQLHKAPKLTREDGRIDWNKPAEAIRNLVKGLSPVPGAWTVGRSPEGHTIQLKIFACEAGLPKGDMSPGTLVTEDRNILKIAAQDRFVLVIELQQSGKKPMKTQEFLRGAKNLEAYQFENQELKGYR